MQPAKPKVITESLQIPCSRLYWPQKVECQTFSCPLMSNWGHC